MPQTQKKSKTYPKPATNLVTIPGQEVLTLAEAAAYLRVTESEVLRMVHEQCLPGRQVQDDWRFLKTALQDWLRSPPCKKESLLAQIGAFKDDPHLEEMLQEIYKQRGRSETEAG